MWMDVFYMTVGECVRRDNNPPDNSRWCRAASMGLSSTKSACEKTLVNTTVSFP